LDGKLLYLNNIAVTWLSEHTLKSMTAYRSLTDLQLIHLLQGDNEDALTEIYTRYAERLTRFASSRLYGLDDSRDVLHDVFVKLWEERKTLKVDRNLEAYMFTMIRYRIIDRVRKNITREDYSKMVLALRLTEQDGIEAQISARELKQQIEAALERLSPRVKEIYHLSREENLSIAEIAEKLQLSEQTVKNQLTAALKHLRTSLKDLPIFAFVVLFVSLH
jgi:RNA polymerase sigma-70 factor (family 1)